MGCGHLRHREKWRRTSPRPPARVRDRELRVRPASRVERANLIQPSDLSILFGVLLADAAGDKKARDLAFGQFDKYPADRNAVRPIGATLRTWSAADGAPNAEAVEAAVRALPEGLRTDGEFCFGWFLQNRGLGDRAAVLWKRCADTEGVTLWLKTHARVWLDAGAAKKP